MSQCHHKMAQACLFALLLCSMSPSGVADIFSPYDGVWSRLFAVMPCPSFELWKPGYVCLHPYRIPALLCAVYTPAVFQYHHVASVLCPSATLWQRTPTYSQPAMSQCFWHRQPGLHLCHLAALHGNMSPACLHICCVPSRTSMPFCTHVTVVALAPVLILPVSQGCHVMAHTFVYLSGPSTEIGWPD